MSQSCPPEKASVNGTEVVHPPLSEPSHEIMVLFVLRKPILQMHMRSRPVWGWGLVGPFVYFHTTCVRTAKTVAILRGCAGSPEQSLVAYVVSTIISWAGSNILTILITIAISYHGNWNVQHWKGKRIFTVSIFVQHSDVMQMTTWSGRLDLMQMTHSELLGQFRESDSRNWPIRNSSSNSVNQTSDVCKVYYYVLNCSIPFAGRTCVRI